MYNKNGLLQSRSDKLSPSDSLIRNITCNFEAVTLTLQYCSPWNGYSPNIRRQERDENHKLFFHRGTPLSIRLYLVQLKIFSVQHVYRYALYNCFMY